VHKSVMPNFLILGAMKAGTTSLYHYLQQHPQVYMSPIKEPNFFALEGRKLDFNGAEGREWINDRIKREFVTNIAEYRALFEEASSETAIGEASTMYLYSPEAPGRIKHYIPKANLITILRNPVERAYSAFLYMCRDSREPLSDFSEALRAEETRMRNNWEWIWHYKNAGFYYVQLKRYFDVFDQDQIKVYLYEDLRTDTPHVLQSIFKLLKVDDTFTPDTSLRHNLSGVPKNRALFSYIRGPNVVKSVRKPLLPKELRRRISAKLQSRILVEAPSLAPAIRRELIELYRDDILRLEGLIERDLSGWLK
jgi:hypothetical protein